ncbi:MAG: hypothetical protein WBM32_16825 [Crocosphaera sp.]|jgi:hypothetical protein
MAIASFKTLALDIFVLKVKFEIFVSIKAVPTGLIPKKIRRSPKSAHFPLSLKPTNSW